jgi:putative NADH-flavin reductase
MKVLVIGGTRGVGREVVTIAHKSGHSLTVMARNAVGFAVPVTGVRLVLGDAADAADLDRAVAGQDAVVWTVGVKPSRRPVQLFSRGTQFLLAAMGRHGVHRLLCVTGVGAGDSKGRGGFLYDRIVQPLLFKTTYEDKDRQEAQIRASTVDWTIVRPAALTDASPTGLYQTLTTSDGTRARRIARGDVAAFIVENLAAPEYVHQTVLLCG